MIKKHGGNIHKYAREHGISKMEVIDFSANINPLGISKKALEKIEGSFSDILNYPDPDYRELKESISNFENIDPDNIILGNGAIECIFLLGEHIKSEHTLLLAPTFVEYERAFSKYGSSLSFHNLKEEYEFKLNVEEFISNIQDSVDTIVICNPNNPTGCLIDKSELYSILEYCKKKNIILIIDEAFIDFTDNEDENTMKTYISEFDNLIILKSLTKFFAMPGLRLGYLMTSNESVKDDINSNRIPWVINCMASNIAVNSLNDVGYIESTKKNIKAQRKYLTQELTKNNNLNVYPSNANYIFFRCKFDLLSELTKYNIMIRSCSNYRGLNSEYYRIAVKDEKSNGKLIEAINEITK